MGRRGRGAAHVRRRWRPLVVGMVGPHDVADLQTRIHDYRVGLQAAIDALAGQGHGLPIDNTQWSVQAWADLVGRCETFENEAQKAWDPFVYVYAGSAFDRGRALVDALDQWRDELARRNAPGLPAPVPVPHSDVSLLEKAIEFGEGLMVLAGLWLVHKVLEDLR